MKKNLRILVYLGSSVGNKEYFRDAAIEIADWIGKNRHTLVYGGNAYGLMGILADRVKEHGCKLIASIPKYLLETEKPHPDLDIFEIVDTMNERKEFMRNNSDICIALPGGPGTLEEITEAISLYRVKQHNSPCVFYNKNGFYNPIKKMYDDMLENGFMTQEDRKIILFTDDVNEIEEFFDKLKLQ